MRIKKIIAWLAFCMAIVYAIPALYIPIDEAIRLSSSDYSFWWYARQNAGEFGLAAFAFLLAVLSLVYIRKCNSESSLLRDVWLGLIAGGSASFILPFVMISKGFITGDPIITDGMYWWVTWYLLVLFTALPLIVSGVAISSLIGWMHRRKH